jgi:hypothetical protein
MNYSVLVRSIRSICIPKLLTACNAAPDHNGNRRSGWHQQLEMQTKTDGTDETEKATAPTSEARRSGEEQLILWLATAGV